jgi:hypothetical protein
LSCQRGTIKYTENWSHFTDIKNDPLSRNNYRPISLLNIDTNIIAYTLTQRIKPLLHKIINSDQNGYITKRYIGFNIKQIQDTTNYADPFFFLIRQKRSIP